ncbi:hypothetical protein LCGC14_0557320 [marine sediment metagenome]|uniref:Uncharacterized protein n=1 Tax=marine sediment metagenome TaxID=412755 RepID=A0A0F9U9G4_9ZZZZ
MTEHESAILKYAQTIPRTPAADVADYIDDLQFPSHVGERYDSFGLYYGCLPLFYPIYGTYMWHHNKVMRLWYLAQCPAGLAGITEEGFDQTYTNWAGGTIRVQNLGGRRIRIESKGFTLNDPLMLTAVLAIAFGGGDEEDLLYKSVLARCTRRIRDDPDSPDGYKLPDKASAPAFRALAHQHGLSAKQAEAMFADMEASDARMSGERETRNGARKAETEQKLRGEWGDQYDANKEIVKRGTEDHVPELNKIMEQLGLDQHPEWQKMLYGVGRHSQEGTMHTGTGAVTGPADKAGFRAERVKLESQLSDMKKQPGFDPINTGYRQLMSERDGMLRKEAEAHIADQAKAGVTP